MEVFHRDFIVAARDALGGQFCNRPTPPQSQLLQLQHNNILTLDDKTFLNTKAKKALFLSMSPEEH
ncbi:hypothetical protein CR513_38233, partial [Mucuna pruriens]